MSGYSLVRTEETPLSVGIFFVPDDILRLMSASGGRFRVTGSDIVSEKHYTLPIQSCEYAFTGITIDLRKLANYVLDCGIGSIALESVGALLVDQTVYSMLGERGDILLTGDSPTLTKINKYTLTSDEGVLVLSSVGALLIEQNVYSVLGERGDLVLTGDNSTLTVIRVYTLTSLSGNFAVDSLGASLIRTHTHSMLGERGDFSLVGDASSLKKTSTITAEESTRTFTGTDANLFKLTYYSMVGELGAFTLSALDIPKKQTFRIDSEVGSFVWTGQIAGLIKYSAPAITASTVQFTLASPTANLTKNSPNANFANSVDNRLHPSPTGNFLSIFTTRLPSNGTDPPPFNNTPVYNPNLWMGNAADLIPALTGIAWYSHSTPSYGGNCIALSKRHVLEGMHGRPEGNPPALTWVLADGSLVTRTVSYIKNNIGIGSLDPTSCFWMGYLDQDLPDTVPITPLLNPAYTTSLIGKPFVKLNQFDQLLVADVLQEDANSDGFGGVAPSAFGHSLRQLYYADSIPGDSGGPMFMVLGNQLVIMSFLHYGGGGWGTHARIHNASIVTAFNDFNTERGSNFTIQYLSP